MKCARWALFSLLLAGFAFSSSAEAFLTQLRARGYSLIPAPQQVQLNWGEATIDCGWGIESMVGQEHFAMGWLEEWARALHGIEFNGSGPGRIVLQVNPGTVNQTDDPELNNQAYKLEIAGSRIQITGNTDQGLFYGVQSLLQLMRRNGNGDITVPAGSIIDWPDLQLRFIHWDTKHHQKRIETLKRLLDWLAFFKVNCIGFEMEDKYEYPSHPVIGVPGAYTKEQMQELTRYALERHIQLVPVIQSPAHMAYVLKHEEFAHLRSDGSNYQACMCDEEAIQLIFDMYQDMIEATPGVKYFHVSTDEVYYAGTCEKCDRPYNEENRSQAWADYVKRAHRFLTERGRRMLAWVEYPLLPKHILQLPPDLIDGVMGGNPDFIANEAKVGIRQLAYSSTQGGELLFPNHFPTTYRGRQTRGRLEDLSQTVRRGLVMGANPIGSFAAAWDDCGLHEECFWLGWVTVTQYAWTHLTPTVEQNVADFMDAFYGPGKGDMVEVYELLIEGARFFETGWDRVVSKERPRGYGNSNGKGVGGGRSDMLLETPELPGPDKLSVKPTFSTKYAERIEQAKVLKNNNDRLLHILNRNIGRVERNCYNLEVYLSIAWMERHFINTLLTLESAEQSLLSAAEADKEGRPARAVANLMQANNRVSSLLAEFDWMWSELKRIWEKSRYEKGRSVGGSHFVHIMDNVKDHPADRRPGLEYMIASYERMQLPKWRAELVKCIRDYAARHNVPVRGLEEERLED